MPVAVAGTWERGYIAPLNEADLWKFPLRDFGVDLWTMAPVSGINVDGLREFPTMETAVESLRGRYHIVFVQEDAGTELAEFEHPESAAYVFGRVGYSPAADVGTIGDFQIRIQTPAGLGLLWPHQVAAVVLYHRSTQWP